MDIEKAKLLVASRMQEKLLHREILKNKCTDITRSPNPNVSSQSQRSHSLHSRKSGWKTRNSMLEDFSNSQKAPLGFSSTFVTFKKKEFAL